MQTITRSELLKAVEECRDAGGTTAHLLHTIARLTAGPAVAPREFELESANVFDTAGFHFDCLSSEYEQMTGKTPYAPDATFDDLTGDDQAKVIQYVVNEFGELDEEAEEPAPVVLADLLLDVLRMARKLQSEYGEHFAPAAAKTQAALFELLLTQSVGPGMALEAVGHALATGCGIREAVAYVDGQL
ncbi:hypothetical protein ABZ912_05555 [Nonomuraea angiospora]|uniref:hypothetical protein n=1 Tax=Nonomuraea angiospora TaxID=46172 RepID=UPI0033D6790F